MAGYPQARSGRGPVRAALSVSPAVGGEPVEHVDVASSEPGVIFRWDPAVRAAGEPRAMVCLYLVGGAYSGYSAFR